MPKGAPPHILAIDLGSGSVRAAVFDLKGRLQGLASAPLTPTTPRDVLLGKEFNPTAVWRQVAGLVAAALKKARTGGGGIAGVAATSQREGIALLDAKGKTLAMGPNSDTRAFFEGQAIDEERGAAVYRVTGHTPSLLFAPAKLRWLEQQRPAVAARVASILSLDGWLAFQLGGERALESSAAAELGLVDISSRALARDLLGSLGFPSIVPPLVQPGRRIGAVTKAAAAATGLRAGTPVIAAGPDTQCALLGMGVRAPGEIGIVAGTTAPVQMALDAPIVDEKIRTWSGLHLTQKGWVLESNASDAGTAYAWLVATLLGRADVSAFAEAERLAAKAPARAGTLAFLGPQRADMGNIGPKMGGLLFPIPLSIGGADRGRLLRAAKENLAFALRANIEQVEEIAQRKATRISIGGGMAKSALLCRIIADTANREIAIAREAEVAALGAAICAAAGAGCFSDIETASRAMHSPERIVRPRASEALECQEHYEKWQGLTKQMDGLSSFL